MAIRSNHYEAAFEAYLRQRRLPYVAVDEQRRTLTPLRSLKSLDFIVTASGTQQLLIDVKGRKFPSGSNGHRWENWTDSEDLPQLLMWEGLFGSGFRAVLVFAYFLQPECGEVPFEEVFEFRGRRYAFVGVWADEYRAAMQMRSPKWQTVYLPSQAFRELRAPLSRFLSAAS